MESCQALTKKHYQCSNRAKYCINDGGYEVNYCGVKPITTIHQKEKD